MLYVFTPQSSERLKYILGELLGRRIGIDFSVTQNADVFRKYAGAKINYSDLTFKDAINISPHALVFEDIITRQKIAVKDHPEWNKIFFESSPDLPFDIFAASFFLLSRYEEYLPHENDEHGRYAHDQSLAVKNNFIEIPLIDTWAQKLKEKIILSFPATVHHQNHFRFLSTIDIDFAYKYIGIGLRRQVLKLGNSLLKLRLRTAIDQALVIAGLKKDPYDTYDYIENISSHYLTNPFFFILMCSGTTHDKNILPGTKTMHTIIKKISEKHETGLHPSYFSDENKLQEEKNLLETISQKRVTASRQHFLKFSLPDTYRQLIACGFTDDYTMVYSAVCGFRASTSYPFYFFDLVKNEPTTFIVHPTMVMDVTFKNYQCLSPEQAIHKIEHLMNRVKEVNGTFISLWHNSNLCEDNEWKEWREVFEKLHTLATSKTHKSIDHLFNTSANK